MISPPQLLLAPLLLLLLLLLTPLVAASEDYYQSPSAFRAAVLKTHNRYRAEHGAVPALKWSSAAASYAQGVADRCKWSHSGGKYGENLAAGHQDVASAVTDWGDERKDYNWGNPGWNPQAGHFTAIVWKSSSSVGCAAKKCAHIDGAGFGGWFFVCEYWTPGNVMGQFKQNVLPYKKGRRWMGSPASMAGSTAKRDAEAEGEEDR
ncbi:SCP-like extracellular protein [Sphaerosporella brunnea]|uniref:SCP-like extracellular protein n=1 Tax=Sphaerosporella brunnea TaxID=1250544 RepID=A0A5J5F6Z4_9PEZI|nr:SCP-like extracellular protein [Sphaerosporella brunnea]